MGGNNTYMVTVEANVVGNNPAMRMVTVVVTDEVELGTLTGTASVDYAENDTVAVGTYTADGPVTPTWSLSGDDADDFSIGSGMLMFRATPDYEAPTDMGMVNMYMVTVMAEAGGEMGMMDVMGHRNRPGRTRNANGRGQRRIHGERHGRRWDLHGGWFGYC